MLVVRPNLWTNRGIALEDDTDCTVEIERVGPTGPQE
jgi:hypothetical protein